MCFIYPVGFLGMSTFNNYDLRISGENATRHPVTAEGNAQVNGGKALLLDGVAGTYAKVTNPVAIDDFGTGDWTIEMYMNDDGSSDGYPTLVANSGPWVAGSFGLQFNNAANPGEFRVDWNGGGGTKALVSGDTYPSNTKHHIAIVRQGNTARMYVGGIQKDTASLSGGAALNLWQGGEMSIGKWGNDSQFKGLITRLVIYNVAKYPDGTPFTPTPRKTKIDTTDVVFASSFPGELGDTRIVDESRPDDNGLVGFCPDTSGKNNDGIPTNVRWDAATQGYKFDGITSSIDLVTNFNKDIVTFSVSNADADAEGVVFAEANVSSMIDNMSIAHDTDLAQLERRDTVLGFDLIQKVTTDETLLITGQFEEAFAQMWVNGVSAGTSSAVINRTGFDVSSIGRLNRLTPAAYFTGTIWEVRVAALSNISPVERAAVDTQMKTKYGIA